MTVSRRDLLAVQQALIEEFDDLSAKLVANSSLLITRDDIAGFNYLVKLVEVKRSKEPSDPPSYHFAIGTAKAPPQNFTYTVDYKKLTELLLEWMGVYEQAQKQKSLAQRGISKL